MGDQRTREFIIHETSRSHSIIKGRYKLIREKKTSQLFDLETDASESVNIAQQHPELVQQLDGLLSGERVTEPKGFANTYHHWTGSSGVRTSNADNWSDYEYSNAGTTYLTDRDTPQPSWTARVANTGDTPNTASVDADINVLSVEVVGSSSVRGIQTLQLNPGVNLTGRNEIRIAANGILSVNGGVVHSLRWVDIKAGGQLRGTGVIDATVYNGGTVNCEAAKDGRLRFAADYHQTGGSILKVVVGSTAAKPIIVGGNCQLGGLLGVSCSSEFQPTAGTSIPVMEAGTVAGRFINTDSEVVANNGVRFGIEYTADTVKLVAK